MKTNKFNKTFSYISFVLLVSVMTVFTTACASTESGESAGMKLIYETNFSKDDGAFRFGEGEMNEIQDGSLHLRKGSGEAAWAELDRFFGNNSTTTFRIKFGDLVFAHLNFLDRQGDRLLLHFVENQIVVHSILNQEGVSVSELEVSFTPGSWYDVAVSIIDYKVKVSIDGVEIGTVAIDNRLPVEGTNLNIKCHEEEFWIDDLRIVAGPSKMKEVTVSWDSVLYETDFSSDDGGLGHEPPGEINEVREGVLHLKGIKDGQAAHAELGEIYGNNSITTFRIKFGEAYSKERAFADINFLWKHPDDRVKTTFASDAFYIWTRALGQENFEMVPASFVTGRWYDVRVVIEDYKMTVTVDGRLLKTMSLDRRLPSLGHLNFECHDEYWVDDLRVVTGKAEGFVETKPEEKPVELETEQADIQLKLDDSRIAVVGIKIEDDKEKTATALISFVIDAFVNSGLGMMMERQDVSKILEEYKFQQDGITDQSTAIEIGKLAGADVISIGSLYKVGSKHYLNIKLISVETGEIMASSVATAESEDDFFKMCNEAVKNMLQ